MFLNKALSTAGKCPSLYGPVSVSRRFCAGMHKVSSEASQLIVIGHVQTGSYPLNKTRFGIALFLLRNLSTVILDSREPISAFVLLFSTCIASFLILFLGTTLRFSASSPASPPASTFQDTSQPSYHLAFLSFLGHYTVIKNYNIVQSHPR